MLISGVLMKAVIYDADNGLLSGKSTFHLRFIFCFWSSRGVFKTLPNIYDESFCGNSSRLKVVDYFA